MRRYYVTLIAFSLFLVVATVLAGMFFTPQLMDNSQNVERFRVQNHLPALHNQTIFLKVDNPQPEVSGYTLITAPSGEGVISGEPTINSLHCSVAATPVVAPPPGLSLSIDNASSSLSGWNNFSQWFTSVVDNQYIIKLWVPSSQVDEYFLVSGEEYSLPGSCAKVFDEGV